MERARQRSIGPFAAAVAAVVPSGDALVAERGVSQTTVWTVAYHLKGRVSWSDDPTSAKWRLSPVTNGDVDVLDGFRVVLASSRRGDNVALLEECEIAPASACVSGDEGALPGRDREAAHSRG